MLNKKNNLRRDNHSKNGNRDEFEQKVIDLARVTRVMAGGKRMKFRACVVIGDKKGKVGIGLAKGADVSAAITKAVSKAKKNLVQISFFHDSIMFEVREKFKAALILLKPAPKGTGVKAGGAVRIILELCGLPNVVAKILGSNSKINNAQATINALKRFNDEKYKISVDTKKVSSSTKLDEPSIK
ncbi:30S ribosomal protein S5 [Patescibacteria group bacterium]